jgi:hypothetical protein
MSRAVDEIQKKTADEIFIYLVSCLKIHKSPQSALWEIGNFQINLLALSN